MSVETHGDGTLASPGASVLGTAPLPAGARVAVIVSRYHSHVTQQLLDGALAAAKARGAEVDVVPAPGAFELGVLSLEAARTGRYVGVAALGCVIRGETRALRLRLREARARGSPRGASRRACPSRSASSRLDTAEQAFARAGGTAGQQGRRGRRDGAGRRSGAGGPAHR